MSIGRTFVTGMLRSGTSLLQTLITNHDDVFLAYQPFQQLMADVKLTYYAEIGKKVLLPFPDDLSPDKVGIEDFASWLERRVFQGGEARQLIANCTTAKGGSAAELIGQLPEYEGSFADIWGNLQSFLARHYGRPDAAWCGSKEILCEEFLPYSLRQGVKCGVIARDPRAMIASAYHGRYLDSVGDRYPLLMLIRMWRKSVAFWLFAKDAGAYVVRYEDLVTSPDACLERYAQYLNISAFPNDMGNRPLRDHMGNIWSGNSSFGDKNGVDPSGRNDWKELLTSAEIAFIEACCEPEMQALGYPLTCTRHDSDITGFVENEHSVRLSYLEHYRTDQLQKEREVARRGILANSGKVDSSLFLDASTESLLSRALHATSPTMR